MEQNASVIAKAIKNSLDIIEQDREKEIISRRFGLSGQKETLEQIGEMLGITRERVRQLEKAISIRLKIAAEENQLSDLAAAEKIIIRNLTELGRISKVSDLADKIYQKKSTKREQYKICFLAEISTHLIALGDTDRRHAAIGIIDYGDEKTINKNIVEIVNLIKTKKTPQTIEQLDDELNYEHPNYILAIASLSKQLATLNGLWGLAKWPSVNPKNIRDKIYVILDEKKQPMHFSKIAEAIQNSTFNVVMLLSRPFITN